jgi:hypothetical protein
MTPSELALAFIPLGGPLKLLLGGMTKDLDENPLLVSVTEVMKVLASKEGTTVDEFVKSGRAAIVLPALALGKEPPPPGAILDMSRCEKCGDVRYKISG